MVSWVIGYEEFIKAKMLSVHKRVEQLTRCTQGVRVVFSVTRMRSNNSARINKSDFTTEKIV